MTDDNRHRSTEVKDEAGRSYGHATAHGKSIKLTPEMVRRIVAAHSPITDQDIADMKQRGWDVLAEARAVLQVRNSLPQGSPGWNEAQADFIRLNSEAIELRKQVEATA